MYLDHEGTAKAIYVRVEANQTRESTGTKQKSAKQIQRNLVQIEICFKTFMFPSRLYSDFNWGLTTQEKKKERNKHISTQCASWAPIRKKPAEKGKKVTCYHPRAETLFVCVFLQSQEG